MTNSSNREKIEKAILEYIGILGHAKSAFMFVNIVEKNSGLKGKVVCSCLRESLNDLRAALAFKKIKIQKVSGTLDCLEK